MFSSSSSSEEESSSPESLQDTSSSASSQDGSENDQYQSLIAGDDTPEDVQNMATEIASMTEVDQLRAQLSKFSSELITVTTRLSELSAEKLQVEFENREIKSKIVPVQIAKKSLEEENAFLKNQLQEFWAEIEKLSTDKNTLYRERCDTVRQLNDELALVKSEMGSLKSRFELAESESQKSKHEVLALRSELGANEERFNVEKSALNSKISQQSSLISNLESQLNVENTNKIQSGSIESKLAKLSHELAESRHAISERDSRITELESEKENLLSELVGVKAKDGKTKKQFSIVSDLLGRTNWSLSDIVDELSAARRDVISKRKEIDQLTSAIEELNSKVPMIEDGFIKLQNAEEEIGRLSSMNESLKMSFSKMADEIDSLKFERIKMETESQSLRIRNSELTKQVAGLIHENELFRSRQGLHAGLGRSTPALTAPVAAALPATDDSEPPNSAKRRKSSLGSILAVPSDSLSIVPHFRTVHDLVEQNSQLKDRVENLLAECETESQIELAKLRSQYANIEHMNSELVVKRKEDREEFDRVVSRLEKDLSKHQSENAKLKALIQYTGGNVEMVDEEIAKELVPVLQSQIQATRDELNKHIQLVNSELTELKKVHAATVQDLEKAHFESSRNLDEKNFVQNQLEILKNQSMDVFERNRELHSKLNQAESAKDTAEIRVNEMSTKLMLFEKSKRELEMKISGLQSTITAMETAYRDLVAEKESQSALLIGYHDRLQKETDMYQSNAETLKTLYAKESEKYHERLNFYQSAYEEQVKRSTELSALLSRVESDLAATRAEKQGLAKQAEEAKVRARLSEVSSSAPLVSPSSLTRDIARLEVQVKLTEEDLAKYKDLAKINEQMVLEKEKEISGLEKLVEELRSEISTLQLSVAAEHEKMDIEEQIVVVPEPVQISMQADTAEIDRLTAQISNLNHSITLLEKRVEDEQSQKFELEKKLNESFDKIKHLQDTIHSERLIISAKESQVSADHISAKTRAETLEKERASMEQKIALLRAENEKYLAYFASDLSASEKESRGAAVIEQLKQSIQTTASKESQLLMDVQRARNTVELLTKESMGLRSLVGEREKTINELTESKLELERELAKLKDLDAARAEKEMEITKLKDRLVVLEQSKVELANTREKLTLSESNLARVKHELEIVGKQSEEFKRLHQELVEKMALVGSGSEAAKETEQRLSQENAQLEKAKSQLTQTVSKLREEAREKISELGVANERIGKMEADLKQVQSQLQTKEKEIVRQDGLMKLKDKRIAELEAVEAPMATSESAALSNEVMDLLDEYQGLVARLAKKQQPRESVYHDASEGDATQSDQQMD